jgi:hypothetical protein
MILDRIAGACVPDRFLNLDSRFRTPSDAIGSLLLEVDRDGMGLSRRYIVLCIHANFPTAVTKIISVKKIATALRKMDIVLPRRKPDVGEDWRPNL